MRISLFLIVLLGAGFSPFAVGAPHCGNNVLALDQEFQAATGRKDVAAIGRLLPDDYILITSKGEVETKAGLLAEARDPKVVYSHQEDSRQTVRIWGDTAVITALLWAAGTEDGKPFEYRVWFSDVYVCTPRGWRYSFGQAGARA
ncbi:MAG TPA: nuclear transport factor 2 family protein [Gammaproteobacteria bacterium]|nr:nuclear transport factor 2 family protein [Gammaproteobacteria bacterium]